MSHNLTDFTRENLPLTEIKKLTQNLERQKTVQVQGTQATRLAVVEGFLRVNCNGPSAPVNAFVDIAAPDSATVLTGSLVSSMYLVSGPVGVGTPYTVRSIGSNNTWWGDLNASIWMTYAKPYSPASSAYSPATVQQYRVDDDKIRIGARVNWRMAQPVSPSIDVFFFYQLRMTLGWSEGGA